jgi:hypothetical protein
MSNVEIEQSGKMENLAQDTILALSNDVQRAIWIPAAVKRKAVARLRWEGKSKLRAVLRLFVAGLFLLIKEDLKRINQVTIDTEYTGYEADIRGMLLHRIQRVEPMFEKERLVFRGVGKKSPAHRLALATFRGERDPDDVIDENTLLAAA